MNNTYTCNHPIDIAYSLHTLVQDNSDDVRIIESDLQEAMYQLKAIADNPYNSEYWRTLYKALSLIAGIPDLQALPF